MREPQGHYACVDGEIENIHMDPKGLCLCLKVKDTGDGANMQVLIVRSHYNGRNPKAVDYIHHLLQVNDTVRIWGHLASIERGPPTVHAVHVDVLDLDLTSSSRVLALLGDAQAKRHGLTKGLACRLLGLDVRVWNHLLLLLAVPLQRREDEMRHALVRMHQDRAALDGPEQAQRVVAAVRRRQRALYVVLEASYNVRNVAAAMRSCDAFGVTQVLLVSPVVEVLAQELHEASSSASTWMDWTVFATFEECTAFLDGIEGGVQSFATVIPNNHTVSLHHADFCCGDKGVALWFGNEVTGLSPEALAYCSTHVTVPMRGVVESLNVSVCVAVLCAEVTGQRLKRWPNNGQEHWDWTLPLADQEVIIQRLLNTQRGRQLQDLT